MMRLTHPHPIGSGVRLGDCLLTDLRTHADGLAPPRVRVEDVTDGGLVLLVQGLGQFAPFPVPTSHTVAVPGHPGWVVTCFGVTLGGPVYDRRGFAFLTFRGVRG